MKKRNNIPGGLIAGGRGEKNVGWRIDYQVITAGLKNAVRSASIYKEQFFSDHAPLLMEYAIIADETGIKIE